MSSIFFRTLALMSVLLCGVSADQAISIDCNETVNVTSGQVLNLKCVIELIQDDCENVYVKWSDAVEDLCVNNTCTSDNETFATLKMLNVTENKNITVEVNANCGRDSKTVSVTVSPGDSVTVSSENDTIDTLTQPPEKFVAVYAAVIGIVAVVGAVFVHIIVKRKFHQCHQQKNQML